MRTSETIAWVLVAGCCAGHPNGETVATTAAVGERPAAVERPATEEFVVIDLEEAGRRLWPRPGPTAYGPASVEEQAALGRLIGRMLTEEVGPSGLAVDARAAGYVVEGWVLGGQRVLVAVEGVKRGGGAYLVRVGSTSPVILQAPHAFFDLGTERIALAMFAAEKGWPRALFVNTIHRYVGVDGVKLVQDNAPADPCHNPEHLFNYATKAALVAVKRAEVVQLHGFGEGEGLEFAAIVSAGLPRATERSRAVATALRGVLGSVALYPEDTDKLGAQSNEQKRAMQAIDAMDGPGEGTARGFVHVELSAAARQQLRGDEQLRGRVAAALRAPGS